jgi:hypothetical protein
LSETEACNTRRFIEPQLDLAAKRRKKHKNQISGLVNSRCYNEHKSYFWLFTIPSQLNWENIANLAGWFAFHDLCIIITIIYFNGGGRKNKSGGHTETLRDPILSNPL